MATDKIDGVFVPTRVYETLLRVAAAYEAGLLTNRPPAEPVRGGRGGSAVRVGIAKENIKAGGKGEVYFTTPGEEQGDEQKGNDSIEMYSHYGLVREGARVLYTRTNSGYEILQAPC